VRILCGFGFQVVRFRGSHIKLHRAGPHGSSQTLIIPNHRELDVGTLNEIFKQARRYVQQADLRPHFFRE
jgi:predicted RNA binding protein YcfA (HicA-like mRNA interferase family)